MYNKSKIMCHAWQLYKYELNFYITICAATKRELFSNALKKAWAEAKGTVEEHNPIEAAIIVLESKKRWTRCDYQAHADLQNELRMAA